MKSALDSTSSDELAVAVRSAQDFVDRTYNFKIPPELAEQIRGLMKRNHADDPVDLIQKALGVLSLVDEDHVLAIYNPETDEIRKVKL